MVLFATASTYLGALKAATLLHNLLLHTILRVPMKFFDVTPLGRIINRFAKEVDTLDSVLPMSFRGWTTCLFAVCRLVLFYRFSFFFLIFIFFFIIELLILREFCMMNLAWYHYFTSYTRFLEYGSNYWNLLQNFEPNSSIQNFCYVRINSVFYREERFRYYCLSFNEKLKKIILVNWLKLALIIK